MIKDNKKLVVESIFIKEAIKEKLSLNEFLLLLFFDNSFDSIFDINLVCKTLNMNEFDVLEAYGSLISKKIIKVVAEKDGFGKVIERVSIDNFYNEIKEDSKKKQREESKNDIYAIFESELGRTLSSADYECINGWLERGYDESLIIAALKKATENGIVHIRYIEKILYEWGKKGFKIEDDVTKSENDDDYKLLETSVLNFDWVNEKR